jgi:formylmethanofuran dehydrogenase subunit E
MARKVKFWSWQPAMQEYYAINQNAQELDLASHNIESLAKACVRQGQQIAQQQQELLHLRAVVTGLIDALHAKGSFDDDELETAVKQAYAELVPPAPAAVSGPTVVCSKCGRQVAAARADLTASGPVCDACT